MKAPSIELPPLKPIFDMAKIIKNINIKLKESCPLNGALIELIDVKNMHRTWITYEFYGTANYYEIRNNNNVKKSCSITYRDYDNFEALTLKHLNIQQKWRNE